MNNKTVPTILVIFGITGDLNRRKVVPALFKLHLQNKLPKLFNVIGFGRRGWTSKDLQNYIFEILEQNPSINEGDQAVPEFINSFSYHKGDFNDLSTFRSLFEKVGGIDNKWSACSNKLYYLAVSPKYFSQIFKNLHNAHLTDPCSDEEGWTRVLVEKPYGIDAKSAQKLDMQLFEYFKEEQIYRIDHFMAKEMVQNILTFRFNNAIFESAWKSGLVESINITLSETVGVDDRGEYYDQIGAVRDVGQNHLLQILALLTMKSPKNLDDCNVRLERENALNGLKLYSLDEFDDGSSEDGLSAIRKFTTRGQYKGYRQIEGVSKTSHTETFFRIQGKVAIENSKENLKEVPFMIESGKKLAQNFLRATVNFANDFATNRLIFDLSGNELGIKVDLWAKKTGLSMELEKRTLGFSLCEDGSVCEIAEPYERLILDCIEGNQLLFTSTNEVKYMWNFIDPIICAWDSGEVPLIEYEPGTDIIKIR